MSITKPVLNKINALTTNCREAYLILENTYGGNLTVAEMAFLDNMLDKKKETTESAETFIENWIQLSLQTGITRKKENDTRQQARLIKLTGCVRTLIPKTGTYIKSQNQDILEIRFEDSVM